MTHAPELGADPDSARVVLTFPAKPEYVGLVRLALAGLGAWGDLEPETVSDLKVAVSESCALLLGAPASPPTDTTGPEYPDLDRPAIRVDVALAEERWTVIVTLLGQRAPLPGAGSDRGPGENAELDDLGATIIRALVDEADLGESGTPTRTVRLIKSVR